MRFSFPTFDQFLQVETVTVHYRSVKKRVHSEAIITFTSTKTENVGCYIVHTRPLAQSHTKSSGNTTYIFTNGLQVLTQISNTCFYVTKANTFSSKC